VHALLERGLTGKVKIVGFDNPGRGQRARSDQVQALIVQNRTRSAIRAWRGLEADPSPVRAADVDTGSIVATKANMNQPSVHALLVPPT